MSFPNIPNVNGNIKIDRGQVINLLLSSIAFEELGISHLINSEAEKIQYALNGSCFDILDLLKINNSVEKTLRNIIKNQILLQFKLEDILEIPAMQIYYNIATVEANYEEITVKDSAIAYYHTGGTVL